MNQPKWDDDTATWRKYAGELRQHIGTLRDELAEQQETVATLRAKHKRVSALKHNATRLIDRIDRLLRDGDTDAAVKLILARQLSIRESQRRKKREQRAERRRQARAEEV